MWTQITLKPKTYVTHYNLLLIILRISVRFFHENLTKTTEIIHKIKLHRWTVYHLLHTFLQMSRNVRKRAFRYVCPAKILISLCIWVVWSESSLYGAFWIAKDAKFLHADNGDWSDCTEAQDDLSLWWVHNIAQRNIFRDCSSNVLKPKPSYTLFTLVFGHLNPCPAE